jgi:REP element-mobilizing transposase RayT
MRSYIRLRLKGGCYFFTVNLAERHGNDLLLRHIEALRAAFRETRRDHPFAIKGLVILPDHLHCLWQLPPDDDDFPMRWRLIKSRFSRRIETGERISKSRQRRGERGIWQRRYWSMGFETNGIIGRTSTIFITIPSSMDMYGPPRIGPIPRFIAMWRKEYTLSIGPPHGKPWN